MENPLRNTCLKLQEPVARSWITTTMAGWTSISSTAASVTSTHPTLHYETLCIETTETERSPTSPRRPELLLPAGLLAQYGLTTTMMGFWIYSSDSSLISAKKRTSRVAFTKTESVTIVFRKSTSRCPAGCSATTETAPSPTFPQHPASLII